MRVSAGKALNYADSGIVRGISAGILWEAEHFIRGGELYEGVAI